MSPHQRKWIGPAELELGKVNKTRRRIRDQGYLMVFTLTEGEYLDIKILSTPVVNVGEPQCL